jgi:hypothetical protein
MMKIADTPTYPLRVSATSNLDLIGVNSPWAAWLGVALVAAAMHICDKE